jgi:putative ABC transport system ATP-binding protein
MSESLVSVKEVNKIYQRGGETLVVLDDVNLEVPKGDFLALMGPSGSGKSTLLNLIGGLDTPTSGSIEVDGERLDTLNSKALSKWRASHIGFIFQFYNLLPVLTAFRNVELPLLLTKLSGSERRQHVETVLNIVSLEDRSSHKPSELSGGQQQRVAIARALVSDPDILVCDEPTGDLDRGTATEILQLLKILNRDHGKTILMVTHDPMAAESAKRILHLDKGKLTY